MADYSTYVTTKASTAVYKDDHLTTQLGTINNNTYFSGREVNTAGIPSIQIVGIENKNSDYKKYVNGYINRGSDRQTKVGNGAVQQYVKHDSAMLTVYQKHPTMGFISYGKISSSAEVWAVPSTISSSFLVITRCSVSGYKGYYIKSSDVGAKTSGLGDEWITQASEGVTGTASNAIIDPSTGTVVGTNTDPYADVEDMEPWPEDHYVEDFFTYSASSGARTSGDYTLTIQDMRGIFGAPHQWLPLTDPRATTGDDIFSLSGIGRMYSSKIVKTIPVVFITPGVPNFMASFNDTQKTNFLSALLLKDDSDEYASLQEALGGDFGKYYVLKFAYTDYFHYVNNMLRTAAIYLGIQDETIDGEALGTYQWLYHSQNLDNEGNPSGDGNDIFGQSGLKNIFGEYSGAIPFYADCGTSVSDSFANSTTESQLAGALNSLSDQARELNFMVNNVGGNLGVAGGLLSSLTGTKDDGTKNGIGSALIEVNKVIDTALGKYNVLHNILNKGAVIMSGGRIIFPEIWADSTFSRSYNCSMKLVATSGSRLGIFMDILVPLYHLLGLVLPRQVEVSQTYYSPFLVRAYSKGLFNIDMGIITDMNINRGAEGEWTGDGLATVMEVSFGIKDMYDGLSMSYNVKGMMANVSELDYIGNTCGININDHEYMRVAKLWLYLTAGQIKDKIEIGIFGKLSEKINQKIQNVFGVF